MIKTQFDLTIAEYQSAEDFNIDEAGQAQIIRGFVPGGIYHPSSLIWRGEIPDLSNPTSIIRSKKEKKELSKSKAYFLDQGYTIQTVPVTAELYQEFKLLYAKTTLAKKRALSLNMDEQVLGKIALQIPVYCSGLFKNDQLMSGLLFSLKGNEVFVSFGAKEKFADVRGGVGGVLEAELLQFCAAHSISRIAHGTSSCPAGVYTHSGLFEFKARYGFTAYPTENWITTFLDPSIALSDLIFITITNHQLQYKVFTDELTSDLDKKYKTKEVSHISCSLKEELLESYNEVRTKGLLYL